MLWPSLFVVWTLELAAVACKILSSCSHLVANKHLLYMLTPLLTSSSSSGCGSQTRPLALCTCLVYPRSIPRYRWRGSGSTSTSVSTCWSPQEPERPSWHTSVEQIPGREGCREKNSGENVLSIWQRVSWTGREKKVKDSPTHVVCQEAGLIN